VTGRLQNLPPAFSPGWRLSASAEESRCDPRRSPRSILANQVTRLVEGPTTTGVNPGYDHLAGLSALLRASLGVHDVSTDFLGSCCTVVGTVLG
jgi:hypothetical protein